MYLLILGLYIWIVLFLLLTNSNAKAKEIQIFVQLDSMHPIIEKKDCLIQDIYKILEKKKIDTKNLILNNNHPLSTNSRIEDLGIMDGSLIFGTFKVAGGSQNCNCPDKLSCVCEEKIRVKIYGNISH